MAKLKSGSKVLSPTLDFKSLLFSEYLSDCADFGVILFVETRFVIFRTKM